MNILPHVLILLAIFFTYFIFLDVEFEFYDSKESIIKNSNNKKNEEKLGKGMNGCPRQERWFLCGNSAEYCHGWWYPPENCQEDSFRNSPIILMSHGLGAQKDMGLEKYALKFQKRRIGVFAIDYRTFGGSEGYPRNFVDPKSHVQDILSAYDFLKKVKPHPSVDIYMWGTSYGGGHVLVASAYLQILKNSEMISKEEEEKEEEGLKGVIAQIPHLNGRSLLKRNYSRRGILFLVKSFFVGLTDLILSRVFQSPFVTLYVPLIGDKPSRLSLMSVSSEELKKYFSKHPKEYLGRWKNRAVARILLRARNYNPIDYVDHIDVPVMYIAADHDVLCPLEYTMEANEKTKESILSVKKNTTHFSMYSEEMVEETVEEITSFIKNTTIF